MTVADAGVANRQTLESQLINHAACRRTWRILEYAAGAFLAEGLAGSPFFVADTNTLEDFLERLGGKFQCHRKHHIIGRKRSVPVFERNLIVPEDFDLAARGPVELHLPDIAADLHAVGSGIHTQGATDGAGNTDETLHPAEVVFSAEGDHAAEVGRGVDMGKTAIEHYIWLGT